jgi:amylosucrase
VYRKKFSQLFTQLVKNHKIPAIYQANFKERFDANIADIEDIYQELYGHLPQSEKHFKTLVETLFSAFSERRKDLKERDIEKSLKDFWFTDQNLMGMSLYVDQFAGKLKEMPKKLGYLQELGVNYLHLMPLFESPKGESDGGYAVSNFREVDSRFGTIHDLINFQKEMQKNQMYLMIDIVLNHTSHHHEWAKLAKAGNKEFQEYFYFYENREIPDIMDETMPEIFPESSPGSFTYVKELDKWVMSVFHSYQWDLNYKNPIVLNEMLKNIFFYANMGVDVLRIDAPAFIWKEPGTTCQNLPQAHQLLRFIRLCVEISSPGMALLGEAIVGPHQIMEYFGTGRFIAHECDIAYNATQMAVQWDALATQDTRIMLEAQKVLKDKPLGATWINYTRCHDDIGLGFDDYMIENVGYTPYLHRNFLKEYYSGEHEISPSMGALFAVNPKTNDARISGSLASLCGLEKGLELRNNDLIAESLNKILMMQAQSFFLGGIPIIFYGDELAYINDYSYLEDPGKSYDNRWMHRPVIDWKKNELRNKKGTIEQIIFSGTQKLIQIRKSKEVFADRKNINWFPSLHRSIVGYSRTKDKKEIHCLFNYSKESAEINLLDLFPEKKRFLDLWTGSKIDVKNFEFKPYQFLILE